MGSETFFTLIQHGELYAPEPLGSPSILLAGGRIVRIGDVAPDALYATGLPCEIVDARGGLVVPGFIDPHEHLIGAGGEQGVASRIPEVPLRAIVEAGITTVVGCLGTDVTTRHLTSLLARARQLRAAGLSAYIYTGGFPVPPLTITGSVTDDLVLIPEVVGLGEVAISDVRSSQPRPDELARLVAQATVGGRIGGKAGIVHFHVGPGRRRLALLHTLLDEHDVEPRQLHATHVNRTYELLDDAIALARRGAYVDLDTVGDDFPRWLRAYRERSGPLDRLTVSSDAHTPGASPARLHAAFVASVRELGLRPEEALPPFTSNVASALQLGEKGRLREGYDGDVAVLDAASLRVVHLFANRRQLVRDGRPLEKEQ
jgi:beta-aspartyl-dipeptidase (metallo-type)